MEKTCVKVCVRCSTLAKDEVRGMVAENDAAAAPPDAVPDHATLRALLLCQIHPKPVLFGNLCFLIEIGLGWSKPILCRTMVA